MVFSHFFSRSKCYSGLFLEEIEKSASLVCLRPRVFFPSVPIQAPESILSKLRLAIDLLIYLSVGLGGFLLPQLYFLVPPWLFNVVFVGWIAYLLVAIAAWRHHRFAYPLAFLLAISTLSVSLPQPEHYSFGASGMIWATLTFVLGSVLQLSLLILIPVDLLKNRSHRN